MRKYRRFTAGAVLVMLPFFVFLAPIAQGRTKVFDSGSAGDSVKLTDTFKEGKDKLIAREPPAEPFVITAAWCSSDLKTEVNWPFEMVANTGRMAVRKGIQLEKEVDKIARAKQRFGAGARTVKVFSKTMGDCDGGQFLYWKPIFTDKKDITFAVNAGNYEGSLVFADVQKTPVFMDKTIDLGEGNKGTFYFEILNYDSFRGNFDKFRTQLLFITWGDVSGKVKQGSNPDDYYRDYIVKIGQTGANDLKIGLVGALYFEEGTDLEIDQVIKGDQSAEDEVVVLSTVGKDMDGVIVAMEGRRNYGEDVLPFERRGLHLTVEEIGSADIPDRDIESIDTGSGTETGSGISTETASFNFCTKYLESCGASDTTAKTWVDSGECNAWWTAAVAGPAYTQGSLQDPGAGANQACYTYHLDASAVSAESAPVHCPHARGQALCVDQTALISTRYVAQNTDTENLSEELSDSTPDEDAEVIPEEELADAESVVEDYAEDIVEEADIKIETNKIVFDKVYRTQEEFGSMLFNGVSGDVPHGVRVLSGTFAWQNTPNVLKVYAAIKAAQTAIFWLKWIATPAKLAAIGAVSAVAVTYVQNVTAAMFGEDYAMSKSQVDKMIETIKKQAAAINKQAEEVVTSEEFEECETTEECTEVIEESNLEEELQETVEESDEQLEQQAESIENDSSQATAEEQYNEGTIPFKDVPQKSGKTATWFLPFVQAAVQYGIVKGYKDPGGKLTGSYGPSDNVTYAQLWKMSVFATGLDKKYGPVNEAGGATWYQTYIDVAKKAQAAATTAKNTDLAAAFGKVIAKVELAPNEPADRDHLAGLMVTGMEVFPAEPTKYKFSDTTDCSWRWQIEYLAALGVVSGKGDSGKYFCKDLMNRAEAAKVATAVSEVSGSTTESQEGTVDEDKIDEEDYAVVVE